ncbi:carboxypeptidase-like regulatory domain-containing protein [Pedobacter sp. UC225_65]|uniref:carboxypeptidase-like regulatory domain-containing protein n=1 Tax=Pedobacter sp. UC225_65 TaxID=3350173 RepID=UPI003670CBA0
MMKTLLIILCCLMLGLNANSQNQPSLQISGKVTDSLDKKPIDFATVLLKNDKKVVIKSVVTEKDGTFILKGLSAGNYAMSIVYVGYQTKVVAVILGTTAKVFDNISLMPSATQLKGVEVTGDRPLIKQEIDRIAYDVKADPESKVNNVLEMMRKVPLLSVDADDNIQLQGNSNYKIPDQWKTFGNDGKKSKRHFKKHACFEHREN